VHTDPIADYLTRIRNAIRAGHDEVEIPLNGLKLEMSRILKEQGYIKDFSRKPAAVGESINVELKYTEDRRPVILGTGPPPLRRPQKRSSCRRWNGHRDRQHLSRRDDRPRSPQQGSRRRGCRLRLVI
jgi:ribosomal protein S8